MKERPILMSAPMVRAILAGTKKQTRRVMKPQPVVLTNDETLKPWLNCGDPQAPKCPYGQPGDRLWVRETWARLPGLLGSGNDSSCCSFRATDHGEGIDKWKPAIHMPRWACRITLEITGVRVEKLGEISEDDAAAEGCKPKLSGTWWQGYQEFNGDLIHQQHQGNAPPDWMIDPKKMAPTPHLDRTARQEFELLWQSINGSWTPEAWVWVIQFQKV